MAGKRVLVGAVVAAVVVAFPFGFGTKTRGNLRKQGVKAEVTAVLGAEYTEKGEG